ncbi:GPR1/FUN34/yaaH family-domain-containing protein [Leptodontidium sp. 2 PMI_412]|nr:GPR1/FUN34/yaaH family-domain-containing protein [Leptodontidium sp. 2 PMI_412]
MGLDGSHLKPVESLKISPELFEKLYLSPENNVHGDLRKTFGNPTPLAVVGFVVALSPLSIELMGWRGASGLSATAYFFGGLLLVVSGLLEFFLGNTFPSVVFMSYGAHFLTFAATFQPFSNAIAAYSPDGTQTQTPEFASSFAFYALFMGLLSFIYLICSLRTNLIFVFVFTGASLGFVLAAASFWTTALGMIVGATLLKGAGGAFFVAAVMGWYLLAAIMFATLDLPWGLPVVDLSTMIKGASQKRKD